MTAHAPMTQAHLPHGARLVPTEGKTLPLLGATLRAFAQAGLGRVVLEQRFTNPHAEPLSVTYKMPLPADAAVSGFAFQIGERHIVGQIDRKAKARERFEEAILEGKTAALLDEERSSLFTQEIGNIPPGAEVIAKITLDQPLTFLAEGAWELRFPLAAAPRYLGTDAAKLGNVSLEVASGPIAARASLFLTIEDELVKGRSPESPSHPLSSVPSGNGWNVELGSGNQVALDRDVVVRWPVAQKKPQAVLAVSRPAGGAQVHPEAERISGAMFALATIVPPEAASKLPSVKRDLTLLIDTSGSMQGEPLTQAKRVASALVESLGDDDTFDLFEFSYTTTAFKSAPERATKKLRAEALKWIQSLVASGGTEMMSGVRAALADRRPESQRQIVLITDGLVGFERDVVGTLLSSLPASARFHALGVGEAANRSLLMPVARAGRGVEAILGVGEDPEKAAKRLLDRMADPVVVDLTVSGSAVVRCAPERLPDLFAGSPARIAMELRPEGGEVVVRGRMFDGDWVWRTKVAPVGPGTGSEAILKLFARERVEDLEARIAGGESKSTIDREIEEIGLAFSISSRLTSWVAITEERMVDPRDPSRHVTMPQALPFAMSAEGLGLRPSTQGMPALSMAQSVGAQSYDLGEMRAGSAAAPQPMMRGKMIALDAPAPRPAAPPMAAGGANWAPPGSFGSTPPEAKGRSAPAPSSSSVSGAPPAPSRAEAASERKKEGGSASVEAPGFDDADEDAVRSPSFAAPVAEKAKKSLVARVVDAVRDAFSSDDQADLALEEERSEGGIAWREIVGRIVLARDGRIVIEIDVVGDPLELVYENAVISLAASDPVATTYVARIDLSASTREGVHAAGTTLRIVLLVDGAPKTFGHVDITLSLARMIHVTARGN